MDEGDGGQLVARSRSKSQGPGARPRSESIARGRSLTPAPGEGFKNAKEKELSIKKADRAQKQMSKKARKGEADRHVPDLKPKHLYAGKRPGFGTANHR